MVTEKVAPTCTISPVMVAVVEVCPALSEASVLHLAGSRLCNQSQQVLLMEVSRTLVHYPVQSETHSHQKEGRVLGGEI